MHDGRFGSLESVLNFYQHGVQESPTLDPMLRSENGLGITLTENDKQALISFLETLTDEQFINDERFAEY
jgi:cytochrome c peroxidase